MDMNDLILVSVDDHNVEPPDAFIRHFPEKLRDKAPKIIKKRNKDVWFFEDKIYPTVGTNAVVGRPRSEYGFEPDAFDRMRKGCYDAKARVDDMNVNGVLGSLNFPTFPNFAGMTFLGVEDKTMATHAVRAYNDWHIHDWCGAAPGRFIPMVILPLWNMQDTLAELKRASDLGVHAITFPDNPALIGLPSIHDDYWKPMWKALNDYKMVINCHIGTGARAAHASDDTPIAAWITTMPMSISNSAADWVYASIWKEYPDMRMALSEGGIGWIPYFLERADFTHEHHGEWTHYDFGDGRKPSDVFKKHILTCFIDDQFGLENLRFLNEDLVAWECDYPHSDTLWPNAPDYLWASVKSLSRTTIDKITHLNAMKLYSFDPFALLGRENCTVGALREAGKDVDISPREHLGGMKTESMDRKEVVTSGQITRMFASAED